MKSVPGDKTWALVGEVDASEAALARPQVCFTDRVIVAPDKVVVNGDVLKLRGVAIGPKHLLVPTDERSSGINYTLCFFFFLFLNSPTRHFKIALFIFLLFKAQKKHNC